MEDGIVCVMTIATVDYDSHAFQLRQPVRLNISVSMAGWVLTQRVPFQTCTVIFVVRHCSFALT